MQAENQVKTSCRAMTSQKDAVRVANEKCSDVHPESGEIYTMVRLIVPKLLSGLIRPSHTTDGKLEIMLDSPFFSATPHDDLGKLHSTCKAAAGEAGQVHTSVLLTC